MKKLNESDEPEEIEDDEEDDPLVEAEEASLDEIVAKAPDTAELEEDDDPVLDLTREERLESLSIRAAPKQPNEFVCASCHLVKHNSQLADRKEQLCRDCV